jgi:hypothetical protein
MQFLHYIYLNIAQHLSFLRPNNLNPPKQRKENTGTMSLIEFTEDVSSSLTSATLRFDLAQATRQKVAREACRHEPNLRRLVGLCNTLDAYADDLRGFHTSNAIEEPFISDNQYDGGLEDVAKPYSIHSEIEVQVTECSEDSDSDSDSDSESDADSSSEWSSDEESCPSNSRQTDDDDSWSDHSAETVIGDDEEELVKGLADMWLRPASLDKAHSWTAEDLLVLGTRLAIEPVF